MACSVLWKDEGGRPGLIYYTLNQSCLANHFPVSRWENNKAHDQSKLHSFLCYLVIYCSLSHVSRHKPDCGTQGDRGGETALVREWSEVCFKGLLYSLFHISRRLSSSGCWQGQRAHLQQTFPSLFLHALRYFSACKEKCKNHGKCGEEAHDSWHCSAVPSLCCVQAETQRVINSVCQCQRPDSAHVL